MFNEAAAVLLGVVVFGTEAVVLVLTALVIATIFVELLVLVELLVFAVVSKTAALFALSDNLAALRSSVEHPSLVLHAFDEQHPMKGLPFSPELHVNHCASLLLLDTQACVVISP